MSMEALRRLFTPDDDKVVSGHPLVVLGYGLFERSFGADPSAVGRTVSVNNHPMTIVGVALILSWLVAVIFTPYLGVMLLPKKLTTGTHHDVYDRPSTTACAVS